MKMPTRLKVLVITLLYVIVFTMLACMAQRSFGQDVAAPPATFRTNDFGSGPAVAVIWDATNDAPNTAWFRQYTLDGGENWFFPEVLGNSVGAINPETGQLERWRKFFFFLPVNREFMTRAIPYDDPLRWFPPEALFTLSNVGYTIALPDGPRIVVIEGPLPEGKPKKPRKRA